ncbi:hypothetical protein KIPB_008990 [Kipferlia bialata]|uniref:Uncharacterized protein n=1 Tax=Kipferlia bialata TaxID=797122 RepID=A0A9K3GLW4_9EUKA|nr:hypothetical protein KIPB_008990 [Kipferlia bialata]|eukprot:g8990.t1
MSAAPCLRCHHHSLLLSSVYLEDDSAVTGVSNAALAAMTQAEFRDILTASLTKAKGTIGTHSWTGAMLKQFHLAREHSVPPMHLKSKGALIQYTMDWLDSLTPEGFDAELACITANTTIPDVPVGDLPPSLWLKGDGATRHYESVFALVTCLSITTGREWKVGTDKAKGTVVSYLNDLSCTLKIQVEDGKVSLVPVRPTGRCTHTDDPLLTPPHTVISQSPVHILARYPGKALPPLVQTCQIGEREIAAFSKAHPRILHTARLTGQGVEVSNVPAPPGIVRQCPMDMCRVGGRLYVFGTFFDSPSDIHRGPTLMSKAPTTHPRLFYMLLDTRVWTEVESTEGFPKKLWGRIDLQAPIQPRVVLFSLQEDLYVMMHSPVVYTGSYVEREATTTLHRYSPEADMWSSVPMPTGTLSLMSDVSVAVVGQQAHLLGSSLFDSNMSHSVYNPRAEVDDLKWSDTPSLPGSYCDFLQTVSWGRILAAPTARCYPLRREQEEARRAELDREMREIVANNPGIQAVDQQYFMDAVLQWGVQPHLTVRHHAAPILEYDPVTDVWVHWSTLDPGYSLCSLGVETVLHYPMGGSETEATIIFY